MAMLHAPFHSLLRFFRLREHRGRSDVFLRSRDIIPSELNWEIMVHVHIHFVQGHGVLERGKDVKNHHHYKVFNSSS
jgi:hypothetical protein